VGRGTLLFELFLREQLNLLNEDQWVIFADRKMNNEWTDKSTTNLKAHGGQPVERFTELPRLMPKPPPSLSNRREPGDLGLHRSRACSFSRVLAM
jgi:hypothetical protein